MAADIGALYSVKDSCRLPGCHNPRYVEKSGLRHDFCGRTHAELYKRKHGFTPTPLSHTGNIKQRGKSQTYKPVKALHNLSNISPSNVSSRNSIKFYNRDEPYYEFTNFYRAPVDIDGQHWPSTEHYFQAQKFVGTPYSEVIRGLSSAREAFQMSRDPTVSRWRRSDWDSVKDDIMLKALRCKFAQHPNLMKKLWETGDRELIEHTTNDSYWADGGGGGKGLNKLGKLLMKVRDEIVEVGGPFRKPEKCGGRPISLKRSSSLSDLSGHTAKMRRSHSVSPTLTSKLKQTYLESTKSSVPKMNRSTSVSRITSNSSTANGLVKPSSCKLNSTYKGVTLQRGSCSHMAGKDRTLRQENHSSRSTPSYRPLQGRLKTVSARKFYHSSGSSYPTSSYFLSRNSYH